MILKLFKKQKTAEELEKRSQEEKEWAEKCFKAGEKFGDKVDLKKKVASINKFGEKYPITFFSLVIGIIIFSFIINLIIPSCNRYLKERQNSIELISTPKVGTVNSDIAKSLEELYIKMEKLQKELETIVNKKDITMKDSIRVQNIVREMEIVNSSIEKKEKNYDEKN